MSPLTDIVRYNPIALQRLLRRENVALVAIAVQWTCLGLGFVAIAAIVWQVVSTRSHTNQLISTLDVNVRALTALTAPTPRGRGTTPQYQLIVERNIFGPMTAATAPTAPTPPPLKPKAATPLALMGTFVVEGETPQAIIEDQRKKIQDVFEIDALVFGEAKLLSIGTDRVEIERDGQRETLLLDDLATSGRSSGGDSGSVGSDEIVVDEAELDRALENLPLLLTQARAVPYFADGQAVGLRLFAIKSGSLYEKIGLRNGDVLKSVNGNSLADMSQAMQLFERLKTERSISLTIERNREQKELRYQIR